MAISNNDPTVKFFHHFAYFHPKYQKVAALNLWKNGFGIFQRAKVVKDFHDFETIPYGPNARPDLARVMPFMFENIIDKTRIITCFENFMKGALMLQGYIAHKLSKKNNVLRNQQNARPVAIIEVFSASSFQGFDPLNPDTHETSEQTLNFSTLLLPKYQDILQLPDDILKTLTKMNHERNRLHFMSVGEFSIGPSVIGEVKAIIDFYSQVMMPRFLQLNGAMQNMLLPDIGAYDSYAATQPGE